MKISALGLLSLFTINASSKSIMDCDKSMVNCDIARVFWDNNCFNFTEEMEKLKFFDFQDDDNAGYPDELRKIVSSILKEEEYKDFFKASEIRFITTGNTLYENNPKYEYGSFYVFVEDLNKPKILKDKLKHLIDYRVEQIRLACHGNLRSYSPKG